MIIVKLQPSQQLQNDINNRLRVSDSLGRFLFKMSICISHCVCVESRVDWRLVQTYWEITLSLSLVNTHYYQNTILSILQGSLWNQIQIGRSDSWEEIKERKIQFILMSWELSLSLLSRKLFVNNIQRSWHRQDESVVWLFTCEMVLKINLKKPIQCKTW